MVQCHRVDRSRYKYFFPIFAAVTSAKIPARSVFARMHVPEQATNPGFRLWLSTVRINVVPMWPIFQRLQDILIQESAAVL